MNRENYTLRNFIICTLNKDEKGRRMRWGRGAYSAYWEMTNAYKILTTQAEGKRQHGRSQHE
jgi:hypothetical protein